MTNTNETELVGLDYSGMARLQQLAAERAVQEGDAAKVVHHLRVAVEMTADRSVAEELAAVAEWSKEMNRAHIARDHAITRAHVNGASLREIAEVAGMTHAGIAKIVGQFRRENGE